MHAADLCGGGGGLHQRSREVAQSSDAARVIPTGASRLVRLQPSGHRDPLPAFQQRVELSHRCQRAARLQCPLPCVLSTCTAASLASTLLCLRSCTALALCTGKRGIGGMA
jgi:hypothetical protein